MLFRSEEEVDGWCTRGGVPRGATITLEKCWELARGFYEDRLSAGWRRKSPEEYQALFAGLGLTGPFWRLTR